MFVGRVGVEVSFLSVEGEENCVCIGALVGIVERPNFVVVRDEKFESSDVCCGEGRCVGGGVLDGLSGGADGNVMYERFTVVKCIRRCDDGVRASVVDHRVRVGRVWASVR